MLQTESCVAFGIKSDVYWVFALACRRIAEDRKNGSLSSEKGYGRAGNVGGSHVRTGGLMVV